MALVVGIQVLMAAFAGGLLFERWMQRLEQGSTTSWNDDSSTIEFHPELIIRWDDEANDARPAICTHRASVDRRLHVRPQVTTSHPHLHTR